MIQPGPMPPPAGDSLSGKDDPHASLEDVRKAELQYLWWHRHGTKSAQEVESNLIGLALSGGGIRSATTCLGILQALSRMQILPLVDYLSTVSGGGYIGACLSTLLSLTKREIRHSPGDAAWPPEEAFKYRPNEIPGFATEWRRFPFRAERRDKYGRMASDLVAHLRTHGNFLVARRGLFKRESMRAVGHLITGISFNVGLFLGTLFVTGTLLMTAARLLVPALPDALSPASAAAASWAAPGAVRGPLDTLRRQLVVSDSSVECVRPEPFEAGTASGGCEIRTAPEPPTYWQRLFRNFNVVAVEAAAAPEFFLPALLVGTALSALVFLYTVVFLKRYIKGGAAWHGNPKPGESKDERFEIGLLWGLAWVALAGLIGTLVYVRFSYVGCPPELSNRDILGVCRPTGSEPPDGNSQLIVLLVPLAVLLGARVLSYFVALIGPTLTTWTRRFRSIWGAYQAITIYGFWIMLALALVPVAAYTLRDHQATVGLSAVGTLVLTRLLASRRAIVGGGRFQIPAGLRRGLLALAVVLLVALGLVFFASLLADGRPLANLLWWSLSGLVALLLLGYFVDHNKLGPHYFYRDRLAETYLLSELADTDGKLHTFRDAMEMPLRCLHGEPMDQTKAPWKNPAPYHLISAAVNLGGSRDLTRKDRKSGYWLFSKLFCGSIHTGFRPTAKYRDGETKVARAVGISGAAASSAIGTATFFAQAFATVVFNIRLGYWMENPRHPDSRTCQEGGVFWPAYLWQELSMNTTEAGRLVNLSDGGHTGDNIGIYPLLQRRCKVIIACDAERDPGLSFGSFTEALRHAYVDLGVDVDIDLTMIRPDPTTGYSRSHCAVGRIKYPEEPDQENYLIYLKNSLTGDEPEPILNYKSSNPAYPHESTVDQFFDDAQFESYRALGVHLAEHTFGWWNTTKGFQFVSEQHWPG